MLRKLLHRRGWVKVQDLDESFGDGTPGQTVRMLRYGSREKFWGESTRLAADMRAVAREIEKAVPRGDR